MAAMEEGAPCSRPAAPLALGWGTRSAGIAHGWALAGPAFAVSVGYMDPGNWATDLAAGLYGMALLWSILVANAMAIVLQVLCVRLATATGDDLATHLVRRWPRHRSLFWAVSQGTAITTDLAEFTGIVVGLRLLFGIALPVAVVIGAIAVSVLFLLGNDRLRRLEVALISIVGLIAFAFVYELGLIHPSLGAVARGALFPTLPDGGALFLVISIIGATVMPHNLFLHSALVAARGQGLPRTQRLANGAVYHRETIVALNLAAFVNGAILVVGALVSRADGSIEHAHVVLGPLLGTGAAVAFGAALLLSGVAASTTATLAGDVVFRTFSPIRVATSLRRALTLAPAAIALLAGASPTNLLIWSQVALALALPVVVVPLVALTSSGRVMGALANRTGLRIAAIAV